MVSNCNSFCKKWDAFRTVEKLDQRDALGSGRPPGRYLRGGTSGEAPPGEGVPAERAAGAPQARLRRALPSGGGFVQACGGRSNPEVPPLAAEVPPEVPPQGTSLPFCRFSYQTGPTPPRTLPLSSQSASRTAKKGAPDLMQNN